MGFIFQTFGVFHHWQSPLLFDLNNGLRILKSSWKFENRQFNETWKIKLDVAVTFAAKILTIFTNCPN